jgi:RNA polymerase sigma-70 factor (ECF subfamily)
MTVEPFVQATPEQRFLSYVKSGNKAVLPALIQEYADRLYNQARRIIGRDDGAEDAVQEAYLILVRTASRYDGTVPFAAWLSRLVTSSAINYRNRMHRHRNMGDMAEQGVTEMKNNAVSSQVDEKDIEALRTALDSLPDRYRTPLTMYYFGGLNQEETAQALGAPADRIAKQLSRGVEKLRVILGRAGFAATSAGLLTMVTSLPTYAASPAFNASLVASEPVVATGRIFSQHASPAAKALFLAKSAIFFKATAVGVLAIIAVVLLLKPAHDAPTSHTGVKTSVQIDPDLMVYWKLDDGHGQVAADSSGNNFSGTLLDSPVWTSGKLGGALDFNGKGQVRVTNMKLQNNAITLAAWVYHHDFVSGEQRYVTVDDLAVIRCEGVDRRLCFFIRIDGAVKSLQIERALSEATWHHVVGTWDGVEQRLYLDGALVANQGITGSLGSHAGLVTQISDPKEPMVGMIDEARVYNRALSEQDIRLLPR